MRSARWLPLLVRVSHSHLPSCSRTSLNSKHDMGSSMSELMSSAGDWMLLESASPLEASQAPKGYTKMIPSSGMLPTMRTVPSCSLHTQ